MRQPSRSDGAVRPPRAAQQRGPSLVPAQVATRGRHRPATSGSVTDGSIGSSCAGRDASVAR